MYFLKKNALAFYLTLCLPYMHTQAILLTTLDNYICSTTMFDQNGIFIQTVLECILQVESTLYMCLV